MSEGRGSEPALLPERLAEFAERSQHVVQEFWRNQAEAAGEAGYAVPDPRSVGRAFFELGARLCADPGRLVEAQLRLWREQAELWQNTLARMQGVDAPPLVEPERGDRRFKDEAWSEDLLFDYLKQSYLLSARWLRSLVHDVPGLDPKEQEKIDFYTRQFISAVAPSNFILTNPAVLRKAKETGGQNLLDGLERLLADLERGRGRLQISMVDEKAFDVGKNVATSPGKVIYQNDLMQLLQYAPGTEQVHKRPLLIVPPWINKFYILDLQPKNSFIKWCVDQGHTTFVISWVNPRADLAHKDFEDYMLEGPLAALDAIEQATGEREVNILGFCIGGILIATKLAYLAAKGEKRIRSATFLATLFDFKEVGEASVFIDDEQLAQMEKHIAEKGYLEGHYMADMFSMMRENDLIWSFVVNNYLLGREPPPFDLLYWNSDSTRLPATMLLFYLRRFYRENLLMQPGGLSLAGVPI
ncbi:MAG TPA: alpha/beta fold hydrolase, partial [Geminicoccaceae bacterium]|nr:alpha/beta fold hydrolase [Geminicoccaceae bacterium]